MAPIQQTMAPTQQMAHRRNNPPSCFSKGNWLFLPAVTLLLLIPMHVGAEVPEAEELFQKLLQSLQTVDFEGKLTFISRIPEGDPVREAWVIRKAPDKQRIEFTRPPEVRGIGMVMSGKRRWRTRDERDRGRRPFPPLQPDRMGEFLLKDSQLLLRNYDVRVLDGGHVAGRSTYLLEIEPKTTGKPSRKLWMDAEMGVVLKMEHYDSQKRLGQVFAYSEINFKPDIDEAVFRSRDGMEPERMPPGEPGREELWNYNQGKPDLDRIRNEVQLDIILPDQVPAGFVLQSINALKFGERKNVYLRYTDGLTILSVFQSPLEEGKRGPERGGRREDEPPWRGGRVEKMNIGGTECEVISRGPMLIFGWNYGGLYLTLMGELGGKEMVEIVSSFVRRE
jgi:outer membrane lipoprotein-sorting protein